LVSFKAIKLNVAFTIHEIVSTGDDFAFAHTTSAGQTRILNTNLAFKDSNNELFVFRKKQEQWKIHGYLFATPYPPESH